MTEEGRGSPAGTNDATRRPDACRGPALPPPERGSNDPLLTLVLTVGASLLAAGAETERVEDSVARLAHAYGHPQVECFAVPSGVFVSLEDGRAAGLRRVGNRGVDLGRLADWNDLSRRLVRERPDWETAQAWVRDAQRGSFRYPHTSTLLTAGLGNAAFALILGGRPLEATLAFVAGLIVQAGFPVDVRSFTPRFFHAAVGGLLAVLVAVTGARVWPDAVRPGIVVTGAIVLLVPGISLTAAVRDMLTGDFLAAAGRTLEALVMAAALAFGVALGSESFAHVLSLGVLVQGTHAVRPLDAVAVLAAAAAATSYAILWNAPPRVLPACALAGAAAFVAAGLFGVPGGTLPVFFGGSVVSAVAELGAQRLRVPTITILSPGILPLVPGFLAYHSILGFAFGDYTAGIRDMIFTVFWAGGIAMGVAAVTLVFRSLTRPPTDGSGRP